MAICALSTIIFIVLQGYFRILLSIVSNFWSSFKSNLRKFWNFIKNIPSQLIKLLKFLPFLLWNILYFIAFPSWTFIIYSILRPLKLLKTVYLEAVHTKDPAKSIPQVCSMADQDKSFLRSEVFDANAKTAILDNSANCFIWRHCKDFDPTYVTLNYEDFSNIKTAMGERRPIGVRDVNVGWHDDSGNYHTFLLRGMNHVLHSPVNVIVIPELSCLIGDFDVEGTTITSSGLSSILTWDHGKHTRKFYYGEACIPKIAVNDGYSNFYQFCYFIDDIQPIDTQGYLTACPICRSQQPILPPSDATSHEGPYSIGKEVLYKDDDHIEHGIIERVSLGPDKSTTYEIKLKNNDTATATPSQLTALDETEMAKLRTSPEDFINNAK